MSSTKPLTLLHLSDPQFGRNHRFGRTVSSAPDDSFETLVGRLQQDLEILRDKHDLRPDLLAVTGDLAEWGKKQEFEEVFTFLDRTAGFLGLGRDRVLVVPGNHDINRNACEAYFKDCEADDETPREPFWPKFRHYAGFFERFYEGIKGVQFTEAEPWTLFEIQDLRVVVAGLNSTIRESHRDKDHYGWLGETQLRWFAGKLRAYRERGWMRIGLVHHNVQRGAMEDEENLHDTDDLKRILGGEFNLLMHGHTHEGRLHWLSQKLPVLSTGSASVIVDARPKEVPNQYQVIRLYPDRIWYGTRQYAPDQKRWIGDTRSSVDGSQWFQEEEVRFEHVGETFGQSDYADVVRTDQMATVVASYRTHVATTFRRQLLHDLCTRAEDQDIPGGLALLDIFIPQAVHASPPSKDLPRGMEVEGGEEVVTPWDEGSSSMSVEQALFDSKQPWAFLLGAPGAGKTSLTRWFCLKLCVPGELLPELSSELVPVRVEMRRFDERYRAATTNGRSYDFFDYLDQEHAEKAIALRGESLRGLWSSGRLVWLFDGMDEVSDVLSRQRYAEMIVGLRNAGPSRGVITSRIVGAHPILPYFQSAGMGIYTLLDFDDARIQEFIARWHEKAFPSNPEAGAGRRERLERVIAESRPVQDLCKNPLLLTLISLLNRGGELPRRRHLLYRRAVELMAAQWEANKQLPTRVEILHEPEERIAFLRELAWWMMLELKGGSRNLVREEDLLDFTSRFIEARYGKKSEQALRLADALIGHLRERNYILARIGESLFGFVHKAFLEYLVAEAIRSRFAGREIELGWIEELFQHQWSNDSWREVLTLICGMLDEDRPANVMKLLQAILPGLDVSSRESIDFSVFAVQCLAEVRQLDQEPIRTFVFRLAEFVRHEVSDSGMVGASKFASAIHLIGPRWPEPERWSRWAIEEKQNKLTARVVMNVCALLTVPNDRKMSLLGEIVETEKNDFVLMQTLVYLRLSDEAIKGMLVEKDGCGERGRCSIAYAVVYDAGGFGLNRFPDGVVAASVQVLKEILSNSSDSSVRIRAALGLVVAADSTALVQKTLVEYIRGVTEVDTRVVDDIRILSRRAYTAPELRDELLKLSTRFDDWRIHVLVSEALLRAKRAAEAIDRIFRWLERVPGQQSQEQVVAQLLSWASDFQLASEELNRLRTEGGTETSREIANLVCEQIATSSRYRQDHVNIFSMSFDGILEHLEKAGDAPERFVSGLFQHEIPESSKDRVQKVLRRLAANVASPRSALAAVRAMRDLSIVPEAEWRPVLRELAASSLDERVRLDAVRMLGEEGRSKIELLATTAADAEVRTMASFSLQSLKLRATLKEVG